MPSRGQTIREKAPSNILSQPRHAAPPVRSSVDKKARISAPMAEKPCLMQRPDPPCVIIRSDARLWESTRMFQCPRVQATPGCYRVPHETGPRNRRRTTHGCTSRQWLEQTLHIQGTGGNGIFTLAHASACGGPSDAARA